MKLILFIPAKFSKKSTWANQKLKNLLNKKKLELALNDNSSTTLRWLFTVIYETLIYPFVALSQITYFEDVVALLSYSVVQYEGF